MKASRIVLLAAAQFCCTGLMSETALAGGAPALWSNLWRTPDQQGQALLDAGEPAQAAARFNDPRRRAYADLESGHYPEAAKLLEPFADAQSEYNRGNALAHSGQLQAALAAYDAALKQAPADKDIRHNRDLVERALRQQRQSPQSSSGNRRQGNQGTGSSGQQRQQSGGQRGGSGSQQSGPQSAGGQSASNGSQGGSGQSGNSGGRPNSPQATDRGAGASKDSPDEARRDAQFAAGLAHAQPQHNGSSNTSQAQGSQGNGASSPKGTGQATDSGRLVAGGVRTPRQKPQTERQLALEQWLRQIPDSPAGLLQRKFLIEHMMKQQDGDAAPEVGR